MSSPKHDTAEEIPQQLQERKPKLIRRNESLDIESSKLDGGARHNHRSKVGDWSMILHLAFQSIGVAFGDLGTSPLYVYPSAFSDGIKHNDDIIGVLSLIYYTLTIIPLIKYAFIVLRANDNGDGGTFALYSKICRYAKVSLVPNQQAEDRDVSTFQLDLPNNGMRRAPRIKTILEKSRFAKFFLLFVTMLGTSMVIGDGVLTPCVSVLSAMGGMKQAKANMSQDAVVWASVAVLVLLFMVQRFGTDKVGYTFAPILCIWFLFISGIGIYNFTKYDPSVVKAVNPQYIIEYFKRNQKHAWISLGGVILTTTGSEALFADVGHFTVKSIQISMCTVIYPSIILAYTGQASYLRKHNDAALDAFYKSVPGTMYWPMFVVAILASIIASQSLISGAFSIVQQSLSLGCFPRVRVVHTSSKYEGQVYIPEVNYLLMLACVFVTIGFRTTLQLSNAYGIAVVFVLTITSGLLVLVMIMIWKTNMVLIILYVMTIGLIELVYLSSVLYKFDQGGYLPLAFAFFLMLVMLIWNYVYRKKYYFELDHKISPDDVKEIMMEKRFYRLPGLAIFYSELVHGIPPIFKHYVANVPALHSVLVFVSIKSLPISKVPVEERFLFRRVQSNDFQVYRCVVRYGYTDVRNEQESFENLLVEQLKIFIREDWTSMTNTLDRAQKDCETDDDNSTKGENACNGIVKEEETINRDIQVLDEAWKCGVAHFVGEHEVVARKGSNICKRIIIDYAYNFLKRNLRQSNQVFDIPQERMLKVGMTYEL